MADLQEVEGHLGQAKIDFEARDYAKARGELSTVIADGIDLVPPLIAANVYYNRALCCSLLLDPGTVLGDLEKAFDLEESLQQDARGCPQLAWGREYVPGVQALMAIY